MDTALAGLSLLLARLCDGVGLAAVSSHVHLGRIAGQR